jgi:hypothetical protein
VKGCSDHRLWLHVWRCRQCRAAHLKGDVRLCEIGLALYVVRSNDALQWRASVWDVFHRDHVAPHRGRRMFMSSQALGAPERLLEIAYL